MQLSVQARSLATAYNPVRDGVRYSRIARFASADGTRSVTIIPTPRFALQSFYDSWVYQPYLKDNYMIIANDTFVATMVMGAQGELTKPDCKYVAFKQTNLPTPESMNIDRKDARRKALPLNHPLRKTLTPIATRDANHPWVYQYTLNLVKGAARDHETASIVALLTPFQVPAAVRALERAGFKMEDETEVVVGDDAELRAIEDKGYRFDALLIYYLYALVGFNVLHFLWRWYCAVVELKQERDAQIAARLAEENTKT